MHKNLYVSAEGRDLANLLRMKPIEMTKRSGPSVALLAELPSEECGCDEEIWKIDSLYAIIHMEEKGDSEIIMFFGEDTEERSVPCDNIEQLRAEMFKWVADIKTNPGYREH